MAQQLATAVKKVELNDILGADFSPDNQVVRINGRPIGITHSENLMAFVGYLGPHMRDSLLLPFIIDDHIGNYQNPSMAASLLKAASEDRAAVDIEGLVVNTRLPDDKAHLPYDSNSATVPRYALSVTAVEYRGVRIPLNIQR